MFWGCIGYHGVGQLVELHGRVNAAAYIEVLQGNLAASVENIFGDPDTPYVFQQDNAPVHTAAATTDWIENEGISVMRWPAYSPDINIIEHVWYWIFKKLRSDPPRTLDALRRRVFLHWNQITPNSIERLYNSLPRRIAQLIRRRGFPTSY